MDFKLLTHSAMEWGGVLDGPSASASVPRRASFNPALHQFRPAVETKRALNAAKLSRAFAKPFVAALSHHPDGVYALRRSSVHAHNLASAAADGSLAVWDTAAGVASPGAPLKPALDIPRAHDGFIRDIAYIAGDRGEDVERILTAADDMAIKMWRHDLQLCASSAVAPAPQDVSPVAAFSHTRPFASVDAHPSDPARFASASSVLHLWDTSRSAPIQTLSWSPNADALDTLRHARYNPANPTLISACSASDRGVCIFDTRANTAVRKIVSQLATNATAWNPMEPLNFVAAGDGGDCYTYDMRKLGAALTVHKDHVNAVVAVAFAPTGQEFATGSYDRTIRIFPSSAGHSREVYHTKRMQKVFAVSYSGDARFIFSGSDDHDVRIWKAAASAPLKPLLGPEKAKLEYAAALTERYGHVSEVRRVMRNRSLPKGVTSQQRVGEAVKKSRQRKEANVRKNSKKGAEPARKVERKKHIVKELE